MLSAKEYLRQIEVLDLQINDDLMELATIQMGMYGIKGIDYSRDRVQTSPIGDKLCADTTRYVAMNDKINREIDLYVDARDRIIKEIRGLRDKYYIQVLTKIYVQYKTIGMAAREMHLSYKYTLKVHEKALEAFEKQYTDLTYLT